MGRSLRSPNKNYRWVFLLYDPRKTEAIVLVKEKYVSIQSMHDEMSNYFNLAQLRSYASGSRNCPRHLEVRRIREEDEEYENIGVPPRDVQLVDVIRGRNNTQLPGG